MTESSLAPDQESTRYPLSFTQEWFITLDQGDDGGTFLEAEAGSISAREVPLMKALLCRFDDRDSALFVTVHHSVSDAWSIQVILHDLGAFYTARSAGIPAELPPARQYREYAQWQRARAADPQGSGHHDIPSGTVWNLSAEPSGELYGGVLFNLDEFDESTVAGWAAELRRILTGAVREPDRDWRLLTGADA